MTARAETAEQRLAIYRRLAVRNRFVGLLRVALPLFGLLIFAAFVAQVLLASLGSSFGIGKVSFSGDTVSVDTPSYSGVMANGDVYKVSAEAAKTAVTDFNTIQMQNATLLLTKPDGSTMTARTAAGAFETLTQVMTVPGTAVVTNSDGDAGTLSGVTVSLPDQTLTARGRTHITMKNGMTIDSGGLAYDAKTSVWDFGRATVVLPQTPGSEEENAQGDSTQ